MASLVVLFLSPSGGEFQAYPTKSESLTLPRGRWREEPLHCLRCESEVVVLFASYRLWRFNEADPLGSRLKPDLPLSNPKRPLNCRARIGTN